MANIEKYLADLDDAHWKLPKKKAENNFVRDYSPAMDETPSLEKELAYWYQYLIGMLIWMMEIGRVDIITEVSMMAPQMDMNKEGHFEAVLHVFAFVHHKYNSRMVFDPTYTIINMSDFKHCKWKDFYGELK